MKIKGQSRTFYAQTDFFADRYICVITMQPYPG